MHVCYQYEFGRSGHKIDISLDQAHRLYILVLRIDKNLKCVSLSIVFNSTAYRQRSMGRLDDDVENLMITQLCTMYVIYTTLYLELVRAVMRRIL